MNEIDYGSVFGAAGVPGGESETAPAGPSAAEAEAAGSEAAGIAAQPGEAEHRGPSPAFPDPAQPGEAFETRGGGDDAQRGTEQEDDAADAEAARRERQRMLLEGQIAAIGKLDPSVKSLADLLEREEYPRVYDYVRRCRLSITDAFKLANYDRLTQSAAAVAKQAALNAVRSKEHLAATQTRGSGAVTVPKDVQALYRLYNPDATDAEIRAHYAKYHRQ